MTFTVAASLGKSLGWTGEEENSHHPTETIWNHDSDRDRKRIPALQLHSTFQSQDGQVCISKRCDIWFSENVSAMLILPRSRKVQQIINARSATGAALGPGFTWVPSRKLSSNAQELDWLAPGGSKKKTPPESLSGWGWCNHWVKTDG